MHYKNPSDVDVCQNCITCNVTNITLLVIQFWHIYPETHLLEFGNKCQNVIDILKSINVCV